MPLGVFSDLCALLVVLFGPQVDFRSGLGRFHEGTLGKLIDTLLFQHSATDQVVRRLGQLDQSIGPCLADLLLTKPLEKTSTTPFPAT